MPEPVWLLRRGSLFLTALLLAADAARAAPRIRVGPEVLVSGSIPDLQVETTLAASPRDPKNLIGGAISLGDRSAGTRPYVTFDGGSTWEYVPLPRQARDGGDPQVAFTPRGTAIYLELPTVEAGGHFSSPVHAWRSETGGRSWEKAAEIPGLWDHPVVTADPASGRVYLAVLYRKEPRVALFRSDDDGRTFSGPVQVATTDGEKLGLTVISPLVLHDGTVVFTWFEFPMEHQDGQPWVNRFWCAVSRDGGKTFSPPLRIAEGFDAPDLSATSARMSSLPQAAVDRSAGSTRDRIYLTWTDFRMGTARIRFTSSQDAGKTWSESREVAAAELVGATFMPAPAVSSRGIFGVLWFGGSNASYDAWFSASLDGGETFLPPARVSRETSRPETAGNQAAIPVFYRDSKGSSRIAFRFPFTRYPIGGDYAGLAADATGDFHPFWPDSRNGRFQVFSARVRVEPDGGKAAPETVRAEVRSRLDIVFDPPAYDPATREARIPVRLRNRSDQPVYGPLEVKVVDSGKTSKPLDKDLIPILLNASNGQTGVGAVFDYSQALGDFDRLEPGAVTAAVVWRLRMVDLARTPDLHLEIWGNVEK